PRDDVGALRLGPGLSARRTRRRVADEFDGPVRGRVRAARPQPRRSPGLAPGRDGVAPDPGHVGRRGGRSPDRLRSGEGGATWVQTGFQPSLSSIHYASDLFVDPTSSETVFAISVACGFTCAFTAE